jgi:hypothetical protein
VPGVGEAVLGVKALPAEAKQSGRGGSERGMTRCSWGWICKAGSGLKKMTMENNMDKDIVLALIGLALFAILAILVIVLIILTPFLPDEVVAAIIGLISGAFGVSKLRKSCKGKGLGGDVSLSGERTRTEQEVATSRLGYL